MKTLLISAALLLGALSVQSQNTPAQAAKKSSVQFKAGTLIEVAFMSVKPGKEKQLNEEYFAKVMPVAMEYGLRPLLTVGVKNAYSETIKPQMVGFFEWPSAAKKEAFEKDARFLKIKPIRTASLSFLKIGFFKVEKDSEVKLDGSLFYEVYGMDLKPETADQMGKYFEKAGPICSKDYGVDFALSLSPVSVQGFDPNAEGGYSAQSFGIAIWPSEAANTKYFNSPEYNAIKHYKENALKTMGVWQGSALLQ